MAKFGFDLGEVEAGNGGSGGGSYEPLPDGDYVLKATEAVEKPTKAGTGSFIAATFEVVRGEHAGRKVWNNYNINNPSEKAQQIGRAQLKDWATACGKPNADDTDVLIDVQFSCTLGLEKGQNGYGDRNKITGYLLPEVKGAVKPAAKPSPAKTAAAPAKSGNPWD